MAPNGRAFRTMVSRATGLGCITIVGVIVIVVAGAITTFCSKDHGALVNALVGAVVVLYTAETYRLRRITHGAAVFDATTRIHQVLSSTEAYELRGLLHEYFGAAFREVVAECETLRPLLDDGMVLRIPDLVRGALRPDEYALRCFRRAMRARLIGPPNQQKSLSQVAERTLLAFDVVTIAASEGITSAQDALEAYKDVFVKTAKLLLPFVAVHMRLRGESAYKWHYLWALDRLDVKRSKPELSEALVALSKHSREHWQKSKRRSCERPL